MPGSTGQGLSLPLLPQTPSGTRPHKSRGASPWARDKGEEGAFLGLEEAGAPPGESLAGPGWDCTPVRDPDLPKCHPLPQAPSKSHLLLCWWNHFSRNF